MAWYRSFLIACGIGVAVLPLVPPLDSVLAATSAEDISKKIMELQAAIKDYDKKGKVSVDDVGALIQALSDNALVGYDPYPIFKELSAKLKTMLDDLKIRRKVQEDQELGKSASELSKALDNINGDVIVINRFLDLLAKLTSLINANLSNQEVLSAALADSTNPTNESTKARDAFDKAWAKITDRNYKIHVINAWFGDLRTSWREGRLCTATSAIKVLCEQRTDCQLPAAPATQAGKAYDQQVLCGYDPAALVDPKYKGVAIEYTCVRGGQQVWDSVAQYPGTDPATDQSWDPSDINRAVLQSSGMSIRCPFPAAAKSK